MTVLPRAATSPELALLRSDGQSSRLYLSIYSPATIYSARLAAVPDSTDKVASITYTSGSGTLANVLADMTLYVGSSAGAYDYGLCRIRKDGTTLAGTFYIAEESEINWVSNAYLTVVDDFDLWPRHIRINPVDGTTPLMDYDVAYTNQNQAAGSTPTPIMGPHAVLWLRGATVSYSPDASNSWVNGGTIASHQWTATGASSTSGMTTTTPTVTYNAAGNYRLEYTATGDNGVSFTGYRRVFVVTESSGVTTQFEISSSPAGDYNTGGWSFGVTLYDEATLALVRDRALVILHAVDYYGTTQQSIGYVAGSENIIAIGRIAGESIMWGTEDKWGTVTFDVQGPHYWLGKMTAFPTGVKDVSDATTPNKWTKFRGLTLNKAWYHVMAWCTTATRCMDVYPNTDTRRHKRLEAPGGQNIWAQLIEISKRSMLAEPCCDRYGRIFLQINHQLVSDRSSFPTVQTITTADWIDEIRMDRVVVSPDSLVDMSGISWDGVTATPIFSLAPGHVFKHYGAVEVVDRLALVDQATTNTQCGLYSAWKNNRYPRADIKFAGNHRLMDLAPYQRLAIAIAATDTPRGITESLNLIPRSLKFEFNNKSGYTLTSGTFEAEVVADLAVTGDTPPDPPSPPIVPVTPPAEPPAVDPTLTDATECWLATAYSIFYSGDYFAGGQPTWTAIGIPGGETTIYDFYIAVDGSTAYAFGSTGAVYKSINPRVASPTWTDISIANKIYQSRSMWKNYLICHLKDSGTLAHTYGEYNGAAWTQITPAHTMSDFNEVGFRVYNAALPSSFRLFPTGGGAQIGSSFTYSGAFNPWINLNQLAYMTVFRDAGNYLVRNIGSSTNVFDTGSTTAPAAGAIQRPLRGAYSGPHLYIVDGSSRLCASTDGSTFTPIATWLPGVVEDAKRLGGGSLVWLPQTVTANNVVTRLYTQAGAVIRDMTGNFWSLASGNQTFLNLAIVFR